MNKQEMISKIMSLVQAKDTKPELRVRKLLHTSGIRYRLYDKNIPGKPDISIKKYKLAIFINGCFWHRHDNCKKTRTPKTNIEFWNSKFLRNIERDKNVLLELEQQNWTVFTIWECETEDDLKLYNACSKIICYISNYKTRNTHI